MATAPPFSPAFYAAMGLCVQHSREIQRIFLQNPTKRMSQVVQEFLLERAHLLDVDLSDAVERAVIARTITDRVLNLTRGALGAETYYLKALSACLAAIELLHRKVEDAVRLLGLARGGEPADRLLEAAARIDAALAERRGSLQMALVDMDSVIETPPLDDGLREVIQDIGTYIQAELQSTAFAVPLARRGPAPPPAAAAAASPPRRPRPTGSTGSARPRRPRSPWTAPAPSASGTARWRTRRACPAPPRSAPRSPTSSRARAPRASTRPSPAPRATGARPRPWPRSRRRRA